MQQTCEHCGYESPAEARFCRNCGARLAVENEATSAATRSYPPSQPTPPPTEQRHAPSVVGSYEPADTARLYRPPEAPRYTVPPPSRSSTGFWILLALFGVLIISGIVSALVLPGLVEQRSRARAAREGDFPPRLPGSMPPALPAPPAAPNIPAPPIPPPAPPPPPGVGAPTALEQFKYPNATINKTVKVMGNEILMMRTSDELEEVKKFYQNLLGKAALTAEEDEAVVFTSPGSGQKTVVTIKPDKAHSDQIQIVVVRTSFPLPDIR